jgi:hypothetical protein
VTSPYVTGSPRVFLRLDGLVLFVSSLLLFSHTHQHWWWVPVLLFLPDLFMAGYVRSTKIGALVYNLGHTYMLPTIVAIAGWYTNHFLVLAIGLIWLAHVGMDRFAGYGLKYEDDFKHTHLGDLHLNFKKER